MVVMYIFTKIRRINDKKAKLELESIKFKQFPPMNTVNDLFVLRYYLYFKFYT